MKKKIIIISLIFLIILVFFNYRNILKTFYTTNYSEYVEKYAKEQNVDPLLCYAIIKTESNFNPNAVSTSGARGLMQLMTDTAKDVAQNSVIEYTSDENLFEPEKNIQLGITYYSQLKSHFENDVITLAAYNAGIGNVQKWLNDGTIKYDEYGPNIDDIPFNETKKYVKNILKDYDVYKKIYSNN